MCWIVFAHISPISQISYGRPRYPRIDNINQMSDYGILVVILCSLVDRYLHNIMEESPTSILRMNEDSICCIKMEAAHCYDMLVSISQTTQC